MESLINVFPLEGKLFLTANMEAVRKSGIIVPGQSGLLSKQKILAKGPLVTNLDLGDEVEINIAKFIKKIPKTGRSHRPDEPDLSDTVIGEDEVLRIPVYTINGTDVVHLDQYDLLWKYGKENIIDRSKIIKPEDVKL
jgi:hypothetical protein